MFACHFTAAMLAVLLGPVASGVSASQDRAPGVPAQTTGQAPPPAPMPAEGDVEFTLFLSGTRVGIEHVRVAHPGSTWVISSTAQFGAPVSMTVNRFEVKYTNDWQPTELHIEATQSGYGGFKSDPDD